MKLEIDIPEHHYNNIIAFDFVSLGRVPYKGIIMYAIKAIKHGKVLEQEPRKGHCKDCKYFEYDSMAKVDGIPLIVAHEICKRWGDGCKTKENGYCFLYEPQESEG